ncbi:D2-like (plasmid) [Dictyostelium discoideum]|uniref:D2-like n=1 Tax=Dictyostelium discoideum TaxID=44689 RepID=O60984_DICDI|nr:D2-like [Dictyostelium discoideum]AAC14391.1 D2-like [Dictyostelium discoideum]|eukprot:NP_046744.1 D2-like (plasmid) [Dictyostelium discoideum]
MKTSLYLLFFIWLLNYSVVFCSFDAITYINGTYRFMSSDDPVWRDIEPTDPKSKQIQFDFLNIFVNKNDEGYTEIKKDNLLTQRKEIQNSNDSLTPKIFIGFGYVHITFKNVMNRTILLMAGENFLEVNTDKMFLRIDIAQQCSHAPNVQLSIGSGKHSFGKIIPCPAYISESLEKKMKREKINIIKKKQEKLGNSSEINNDLIERLEKEITNLHEDHKLIEEELEELGRIKKLINIFNFYIMFILLAICTSLYYILEAIDKNRRESRKNKEEIIKKYIQQSGSSIYIKKNSGSIKIPPISVILFIFLCVLPTDSINYDNHMCGTVIPLGKGVEKTTETEDNKAFTTYSKGFYSFQVPKNNYILCFNLDDEMGNIIETLYLDLSDYKYVSSGTFAYTTGEFIGHTSQYSACHHDQGCNQGRCGGIKPTDKTCQNSLRKENLATFYPGQSFCSSPAKGSAIGCGAVKELHDMCQYDRASVIPNGPPHDIYTITSTRLNFNYKLVIGSCENCIDYGMVNKSKPISISVSASSDKVDISLHSFEFVEVGDDVFLGQAANRDNPVSGMVGDIQASNHEIWTDKLRGHEISIPAQGLWSNRHFTYGHHTVITNFDYVDSAFKKTRTWEKNSFRRGDCLWNYNKSQKQYECSPSTHGQITGTIEFNQNYTISSNITKVCVEIRSFGPLKNGTRSSSSGSALYVEIRSTCLPGSVIVKSENKNITITTGALKVNKEFMNHTVTYQTNLKKVKAKFCFNEVCITFETELELEKFSLTKFVLDKVSGNGDKSDPGDGDTDTDVESPDRAPSGSGSSGAGIIKLFGKILSFYKGFWSGLLNLLGGKYKIYIYIALGLTCFVLLGLLISYIKNVFFFWK